MLCLLTARVPYDMQAQREERARERLHVSCATTIQKIWRGRWVQAGSTPIVKKRPRFRWEIL